MCKQRYQVDPADYDVHWLVEEDAQGKPVVDEDGFPFDGGLEMELLPVRHWDAMVMALAAR